MLARSVPDLATMRWMVGQLAVGFVQPGTDVVDLGCSLGEAIAPLMERFGATNHFIGIEASAPMVAACRQRFAPLIEAGVIDVRQWDLRDGCPEADASVILCVLTLMFTPVERRFALLSEVYKNTRPGGAFIMVEKVLGGDARTQALWTDLHHEYKRQMGYSSEEIDRKRLSLEGVLVPVTAAWNEQMLERAGFQHVECFWRCVNFAGWLAIRTSSARPPMLADGSATAGAAS
jgi:tRNA (cmo5U34)-methyltransferase